MPGGDGRYALLTPRGAGGIAVVSIRGPGRLAAVARLLERRDGTAPEPASLAGSGPILLRLCIDGAVVDEVLFVDRPARGQTELHLHGSDAVVDALERAVGGFEPEVSTAFGELLTRALDDTQLELALEQCGGEPWCAFVGRLRALDPVLRVREVHAARARCVIARALAVPARCVLVGRQNAGKSTLWNRLLFADRALTGPFAGLTRDPLVEVAVLAGYPYEIVDTAGEGPADDPVDRAAQARARAAGIGALRLLVCDGAQPLGDVERALLGPDTIVVRTKADLRRDDSWPRLAAPCVEVSCVDPGRAPDVRAAVGAALRELRGLPAAPRGGVGGPATIDTGEIDELAAPG